MPRIRPDAGATEVWHAPCPHAGDMTRILCPIDLSDISGHVVDYASALARWHGAQLTFLHVVATAPAMLDEVERGRLVTAMRRTAAGVPATVAPEFLVRRAESSHQGILEQIALARPDCLVLGTHGRTGFERLFLGSVTERVIRKAGCPTLVVPPRAADISPGTPVQFRRVVCAVDFSDCSLAAVEQALCLVRQTAAQLTLLHVVEMPTEIRDNAMDTEVDRIRAAVEAEAMRRLRDLVPHPSRIPGTVTAVVAEGKAWRAIVQKAADVNADLIVMGVHGRGVLDLIVFGSTTHRVIREAKCPVLVVRKARETG